MGIKFVCPNGHKLNVKDFLAGKRGVCPHCDAKFRIPMESGGFAEPLARGDEVDATRASVAAGTTIAPMAAASHAKATVATSPGGGPVRTAAAPMGAAVSNPLDESPTAVWYVRPRTGGQFGPAQGDVMRTWIAEGRVAGDSLVWREGWPDWSIASTVFPQLGGAAVPTPAVVAPVSPVMGGLPMGNAMPVGGAMPLGGALPVGAAMPAAGGVRVSGLPVGGTPMGMPVGAVPAGAIPVGGVPVGGIPAEAPIGAVPGRSAALGGGRIAARRSSDNLTAVFVIILVLVAIVLAFVFAFILFRSEEEAAPAARARVQAAADLTPICSSILGRV